MPHQTSSTFGGSTNSPLSFGSHQTALSTLKLYAVNYVFRTKLYAVNYYVVFLCETSPYVSLSQKRESRIRISPARYIHHVTITREALRVGEDLVSFCTHRCAYGSYTAFLKAAWKRACLSSGKHEQATEIDCAFQYAKWR